MSRITVPTATRGRAPSHSPPDMTFAPGKGLARTLAWIGVGLGTAQLVIPETMSKLSGVRHRGLQHAIGLRNVVTGVAALNSGRPTFAMWGRLAGDAMDLAVLGMATVQGRGQQRAQATAAALVVTGLTSLDLMAASQLTTASRLEG